MMRLTRVVRFEAAHRLVSDQLSDAENERIYGKCCRPGGHGHNYEVEVTLTGEPDPVSGFLMPREEMDARIERALVSRVDHRNLNDVVDEVTTGENLAIVFERWLTAEFPGANDNVRLHAVRVYETARNQFEILSPASQAR